MKNKVERKEEGEVFTKMPNKCGFFLVGSLQEGSAATRFDANDDFAHRKRRRVYTTGVWSCQKGDS